MWRKEKFLVLAGIWMLYYPAHNVVSIWYYAILVPTKGNRELPVCQGYNILHLLCCGNVVNRCHFPRNTCCFQLGQKESKCRVNYYAVPLFPSCCYVLCVVSFESKTTLYVLHKNPPPCISDIFSYRTPIPDTTCDFDLNLYNRLSRYCQWLRYQRDLVAFNTLYSPLRGTVWDLMMARWKGRNM